MARAAPALLLVALPLVAAVLLPLGQAQVPTGIPGYAPPTEKDVRVGALNVSTWVMRDTRSVVASPAFARDPLGALFNTTLAAGSGGVFYVRAVLVDNASGPHRFEAALQADSPDFTLLPRGDALNGTTASPGCSLDPATQALTCELSAANATVDATYAFALAASASPETFGLHAHVASLRDAGGNATQEAAHVIDYDLTVVDPVPAFAVRQAVGDTTVAAWVQGGTRGFAGSGCLAGADAEPTPVAQGTPGGLCILGLTRSGAQHRLNVTAAGPAWALMPSPTWESPPFNASSGGPAAPVTSLTFQPAAEAPLGQAQFHVQVDVLEEANGTWTSQGKADVLVPFTVGAPLVRGPPGPPQVSWLANVPVLAVTAGGLGYLAYQNRQPRLELRSQALRSEQERKPKRGGEPDAAQQAATEESAARQRQEVHEAAWDKKRKILEAKREDVLTSIRVAEERHQRGEITDHVLKGIRERKERQLEGIEKEMEELR